MRIRVFPYRAGSKSARALAEAMGARRLNVTRVTRFRPRDDDVIINWGNSNLPPAGCRVLNHPNNVALASSKTSSLGVMTDADVQCVPYTTHRALAQGWLNEGKSVVVRRVDRGHGGVGIEVVAPGGLAPDAPLYTTYIKKKREYRIHVVGGEVIDWQQKRKESARSAQEVDWQVRNHANGWIFCRGEGCTAPSSNAEELAVRAVRSLGLDFGAVDLGYNEARDEYHVYEVNTAPGLEGTTVARYAEALREAI